MGTVCSQEKDECPTPKDLFKKIATKENTKNSPQIITLIALGLSDNITQKNIKNNEKQLTQLFLIGTKHIREIYNLESYVIKCINFGYNKVKKNIIGNISENITYRLSCALHIGRLLTHKIKYNL